MKKEDLELIKYSAIIYTKDIKEGMYIIDEDDYDSPNPITYVFEVKDVEVFADKVKYRIVAFNFKKEIIHDFIIEAYREPEEPQIEVFFQTIEDALKYGIRKEDIKAT